MYPPISPGVFTGAAFFAAVFAAAFFGDAFRGGEELLELGGRRGTFFGEAWRFGGPVERSEGFKASWPTMNGLNPESTIYEDVTKHLGRSHLLNGRTEV